MTDPTDSRRVGRRTLLNTGALGGANLWRILTGFALQLLIARRLGVDSLGLYATALAVLNVSQVAAELGLPALLTRDLAQHPAFRRSYFRFSLLAQLGMGILVWAGLAVLAYGLALAGDLRQSLLWIGASLPLYAMTSACRTLFQAGERLELVVAVEGLVDALILALSVGALLAGGDVVQLVAVLVITQGVSAAASLWLLGRSRLLAPPQVKADLAVGRLLRAAAPFYGLSLGDVLLQRLDILLLSVVAGASVTGIYTAAYNVVRILTKLVQSYWRALYPTLSRLRPTAQDAYHSLGALALRYALVAALLCAALGSAMAGQVVHLIYGDGYEASAQVLAVLIWITPLFAGETYAITLWMVERRPRTSLLLMAGHLAAIAVLTPLLALRYDAGGAAWAMVIANGLAAASIPLWARNAPLPLVMPSFWRLAMATVAGYGVSSWLPWPVRLLAGFGAYLAVAWALGLWTNADWRRVRSALSREPD